MISYFIPLSSPLLFLMNLKVSGSVGSSLDSELLDSVALFLRVVSSSYNRDMIVFHYYTMQQEWAESAIKQRINI